jgi:hypothetical protein
MPCKVFWGNARKAHAIAFPQTPYLSTFMHRLWINAMIGTIAPDALAGGKTLNLACYAGFDFAWNPFFKMSYLLLSIHLNENVMKKLVLVFTIGLFLAAALGSCTSMRSHTCYAMKVGNHR